MSERTRIEIIKEASEKLVKLTSDPQPGLMTWAQAVLDQLEILSQMYYDLE